MGLIVLTGYTAIYLVAQWNKNLQNKVDERTKQLEQSKQNLKKALEEKKLLLQETNHLVKNNLAQISALLQLQMMTVDDKKYTRLIKDATSRINSMSLIHQALYDTEEYSNISLEEYLKKLCRSVHQSFKNDKTEIELKFNLNKHSVDTQLAVTLGLIVTEILINAFKYAFKNREKGTISISLDERNEKLLLIIEDDGIGLPPEYDSGKATLGMQLIRKFSKQIDATLKINSSKGTIFSLLFEPAH
jgi:two-component sensor histidine kinase